MTPPDDETTEARSVPCSPCRGTGQVISSLGGEPKPVACPWCEGTGIQSPPEHDAQAHWRHPGGDEAA